MNKIFHNYISFLNAVKMPETDVIHPKVDSTVKYDFQVLELVDDKLEKTDVTFVKFADDDVAEEEFGLTTDQLPKLIFFDNQIPVNH
jgi:hypothetical protein